MTTLAQNKRLHALRRAIPHYTDDDWRAYLGREFGVASSKDLTTQQAARAIKMLETLAGENGQVRRGSQMAAGPYAKKLQALWIGLYNLGAVQKRDDKAMTAFVERQTGLSHTRFLTDAKDARKAVEALKKMLDRECRKYGVELPVKDQSRDFIDTKAAICRAVARRAAETGAWGLYSTFEQDWPQLFERYAYTGGKFPASSQFYTPWHWDELARRLAVRTRAHLSKQPKDKQSKKEKAA